MSRNAQTDASRRCRIGRLLCFCLFLALLSQAQAQAPRALFGTNSPNARVVIVEDPYVVENLKPVPERV
ncbi:MAG TPA: hypothetical protein VG754_12565, partial [Verrucomicrobiae bacterium]|nr:hypothetical protein [Verrucomicrobiae bacterium]